MNIESNSGMIRFAMDIQWWVKAIFSADLGGDIFFGVGGAAVKIVGLSFENGKKRKKSSKKITSYPEKTHLFLLK